MANYKRVSDRVYVEQNIYDNNELKSFEPFFVHPVTKEKMPNALMYQEDSEGNRYYVVHPYSWIKEKNSTYHFVQHLVLILRYKTARVRRRYIMGAIDLNNKYER